MRHLRFSLVIAATTFLVMSLPRAGAAQVLVGGRAGVYLADGDPFVGGEVLVELQENLFLNPNVEFVFPERANEVLFNFDLHYDFARRGNAFFWFGGGLAVIYLDPDGTDNSSTDAGANILFGVGFRTSGRWIPYVQAKILASDDSDFALGFGIRF